MDIKQRKAELTPVSIEEWNDSAKAYIKPLDGLETFIIYDLWLAFYRKADPIEDRFNAGFDAAQIALVDKDGAPLLEETDRAAVRNASVLPIIRVFTHALNLLNGQETDGGFKKN